MDRATGLSHFETIFSSAFVAILFYFPFLLFSGPWGKVQAYKYQ